MRIAGAYVSLAKRGSRVLLVVTLLWGTIFVVLFAA